MKHVRAIWHYVWEEPFSWIRECFFQPAKFNREFGGRTLFQRITSMLRLALPMFLVSYPLVLISRAICVAFHLLLLSNITGFLLILAIGVIVSIIVSIVVGITVGIAYGIVFGIAFSTAAGLTGSIAGDIALGITGGIAFGIAANIGFGIRVDIALSIMIGTTVGIVYDVIGDIAYSIVGGIVYSVGIGIAIGSGADIVVGIVGGTAEGIAAGIVVGIAFGIAVGVMGDIAIGIMVSISFIAGYLLFFHRLLFYPISSFSLARTYLTSRVNPPAVFIYLHQSALYWDERVYLPLPYLKDILRLAAKENVEQTLVEINFIAAERPQQLSAAKAITYEIVVSELELRKSLQDIARAMQRLDQIFPQDPRLIDPQWATPFARLRDASQEAQRSLSPLGRQARYESLELMKTKLRQVHPNVAFRDQQLNRRLSNVVETWLIIAQQEQDKLQHAGQELGSIDNPYKPGIILNTNDTTFVGRRDLAQQLESALSRSASRPTFMLYGERRMGKSSTLMYLPRLLGSRYLPIFCDMQKTGVASSIAIFLGTLAEEIHRMMSTRGMKVKPLSYETLREALKENETSVYHTFNRWFDQIERTLELKDWTIVLTLDEFEQLADAQQSGGVQLPALLNWFRHTIQHRPRMALLFSGIHTLEEMEKSTDVNWSSYFVNVRTLHVSFLQREEAYQLVLCAGEERFSDGVIEMIIDVTGCHPFLIQAVCSALIDNLNVERREQANIEDVKKAVEQVLEEWRPYFHDLWRRTDEQQQACLVALRMLRKADISQLTHNNMEERMVRQVLQTLVKRDLVRRDEEDMYSIAAPIFDMWIDINSNTNN
ncbi:MAG TPA: AAA family ATPase [Ktedonobacteraceae bacterium]|jgi:hypothetical protein